MTIDEAADEIAEAIEKNHHTQRRAAVLAILARMQAHRDERFRQIRTHERNAASARWSAARAKSGFGQRQANERAKRLESTVRAIEVEIGIRKAQQ